MTDEMKPNVQLSGTDGNVFAIIGKVQRALRQAGQREKADEFGKKAVQCESYDKVLQLCFEYVEVS